MTTALIGSGSGIIDLVFSKTIDTTDETIAFHYGNFDDAYGDGTVDDAADNGRVYANTDPGDLPTKFGSIGIPSTASGQTTYTWTPPSTTRSANVLVVAGGGGGGFDGAGGGGGGGVTFQSGVAISGAKTIVVGNGGSRATAIQVAAQNGFNSSAFGFTSSGGGGGGSKQSNGASGASGGGGGHPAGYTGGTGTAGGNGGSSSANSGGGGGGASGANGENGGTASGGRGGDGFLASVFGENYGESGWFGGGGGGGTYAIGTGGQGGLGGGGTGGDGTLRNGEDGESHTGGGGGSAGNAGGPPNAGSGGSGVVLVRYIMDNNLIFSNYVVNRGLAVLLDAADTASYSGTGTTWTDISGNGRNGTLQGSVSWVDQGSASYFDFSGANADYINQTAGTSQIYKDICIVFQREDGDFNYLLSKSTTADKSLRMYGSTISNPGNVGDWAETATTYYVNGVADTDAVSVSQNQWYILGGENKNATLLGSAWNYYLGTGYTQGSRNLNGKIAFLALYTEPLTAAEHIHNYNALKHRFGV